MNLKKVKSLNTNSFWNSIGSTLEEIHKTLLTNQFFFFFKQTRLFGNRQMYGVLKGKNEVGVERDLKTRTVRTVVKLFR